MLRTTHSQVLVTALLLVGCNQRVKRLIEMGHVFLIIVMAGLTIAGLLALRGAFRGLRQPGQRWWAALNSVLAVPTLSLPTYLFVVYGSDREPATTIAGGVAIAFMLMLLVLFITAIVRALGEH